MAPGTPIASDGPLGASEGFLHRAPTGHPDVSAACLDADVLTERKHPSHRDDAFAGASAAVHRDAVTGVQQGDQDRFRGCV